MKWMAISAAVHLAVVGMVYVSASKDEGEEGSGEREIAIEIVPAAEAGEEAVIEPAEAGEEAAEIDESADEVEEAGEEAAIETVKAEEEPEEAREKEEAAVRTEERETAEVVARVTPKYPRRARRRGIEGVVKVRVALDEGGGVTAAEVEESGGDEDLDAAALEAARGTQFRAGTLNGIGVKSEIKMTFEFRLK